MNILRIDLGKDKEKVNLYPIADWHLGSSHADIKLMQSMVETIKNDPDGVAIINGDMVNNAIKTSVSDIYEEQMSPEETLDALVEMLKPIKDKIIGIVPGNHEARSAKLTGIQLLKNVAYRLDIVDKYHPIANLIFLTYGVSRGDSRHTFSIYHQHGSGGGSTIGAKANRMKKLGDMILADVYIHSHLHVPMTFKETYFVAMNNTKGIKEIEQTFVMTNSAERFGGYGQAMGLKASSHAPIKIKLRADHRGNKNIKVEL